MKDYDVSGPPPAPGFAPPVIHSRQHGSGIVQAGHTLPEPAPVAQSVPISLDTVLRLAEQSNARIGLAREKLHESEMMSEAACRCWLPKTSAGIAYYRHEGGIQNEDGTLTSSSFSSLLPGVEIRSEIDLREATFRCLNARRQFWQNKGELSQVSNEVLLDAATTYIDLLSARRGEALALEMEKYERKLLRRAAAQLKDEPAVQVMVEGLKALLGNREYALAQLRKRGDAASAKLVYLLGLPPETQLVPMDRTLAPIDLVDASPPANVLVAQALANGPGVQELQALLGLIHEGMAKAEGPGALLPTFQLNVFEGAFGAGPGAALNWDNRLDICVGARWDLTQLLGARQAKRLAQSKLAQAQWSMQDLQGKLAAGVQEAREAIVFAREEISVSKQQVRNASENYRLSQQRLEEGAMGATTDEVVRAIRGLEQAHFNRVTAINAYNKAQVRLLLLLGQPAPSAPAGGVAPHCPK
jgi:outer membrane protein TolC